MRRQRGWDRERPEGWNHCQTKQAELQTTEEKTTIQYTAPTRIYNHKPNRKHPQAAQHTNISEKDVPRFILADLSENSKFLWKCIKINNLWKSILHNLRHLFKAFQWSDDQIPKLYNTNDRLNVTELLTTIRTSTKQTKNTSKITNLRGRLKTADHCVAVWRAGGKPST